MDFKASKQLQVGHFLTTFIQQKKMEDVWVLGNSMKVQICVPLKCSMNISWLVVIKRCPIYSPLRNWHDLLCLRVFVTGRIVIRARNQFDGFFVVVVVVVSGTVVSFSSSLSSERNLSRTICSFPVRVFHRNPSRNPSRNRRPPNNQSYHEDRNEAQDREPRRYHRPRNPPLDWRSTPAWNPSNPITTSDIV